MPQFTIQDFIRQEATRLNVPPELALAVAEQESGFNPDALGPEITEGAARGQRAMGTFQLLPSTARMLGVDPSDHLQNIRGGLTYLGQLLEKHQGDPNKVLAEYGGVVHNTDYVPSVLGRMQRYLSPQPPPEAPSGVLKASGSASGAPQRASSRGLMPEDPLAALSMGAQGATSIEQAPGLLERGRRGVVAVARAYDPTTGEGQRNLAGGVAAIGATVLMRRPITPGMVLPWIERSGVMNLLARATVAPAGAALGGGSTAAVQSLSRGEIPDSAEVVNAAGDQAFSEVLGQSMAGVGRHLLKTPLASSVGRQAKTAIETGVRTLRSAGRAARDAAKVQISDLSGAVAEMTKRGGETTPPPRMTSATLAASPVAQAERAYETLVHPPSVSALEEATRDVLRGYPGVKGVGTGAATKALNDAGQQVRAAAETGPTIDFTPIRARATELGESMRPTPIVGDTPRQIGAPREALEEAQRLLAGASTPRGQEMLAQQVAEFSAQVAKAETKVPPDLPGLLGLIERAPDQISFSDAHKLKMMLDEAVNWDVAAKRHLERITKGLRNTLRASMNTPEYAAATTKYEQAVRLYRKGKGRDLINAIVRGNPDRLATSMLKENQPLGARQIRQLLVEQSAEGGDREAGERAWALLRDHYTFNRIIKGGINGLGDRLRSLAGESPEFVRAVYGDATGQTQLMNLGKVVNAIELAQAVMRAQVSGAKAVASRNASANADAVDSLVQDGINLRDSSLQKFVIGSGTPNELTDAAVFTLGLSPRLTLLSGLKLFFQHPRREDIVKYAAMSSPNTKLFTRLLFTPGTDRAMGNFIRIATGGHLDHQIEEPPNASARPK
jgi:hypothetical protein